MIHNVNIINQNKSSATEIQQREILTDWEEQKRPNEDASFAVDQRMQWIKEGSLCAKGKNAQRERIARGLAHDGCTEASS